MDNLNKLFIKNKNFKLDLSILKMQVSTCTRKSLYMIDYRLLIVTGPKNMNNGIDMNNIHARQLRQKIYP